MSWLVGKLAFLISELARQWLGMSAKSPWSLKLFHKSFLPWTTGFCHNCLQLVFGPDFPWSLTNHSGQVSAYVVLTCTYGVSLNHLPESWYCGQWQTMNHIVDMCPFTKFEGGHNYCHFSNLDAICRSFLNPSRFLMIPLILFIHQFLCLCSDMLL